MKTKTLICAAGMAAATACTGGKQLGTGLDCADMDTTYRPGADFYMYATGGWQKAHPLTAEYSRFGSFDVLQENNNKQLRALIDSVARLDNRQGSVEQKIADLYNSAMDSAALNAHGLEDMAALLRLDIPADGEEAARRWLSEALPGLLRKGADGVFSFYVAADEKDARNNILTIGQGGMTLGQRDYYLDTDTATQAIRRAYMAYIEGLAAHCGLAPEAARRMAGNVMRVETRLARASKSMTELRDPEANYHKMSYAALKRDFPGIEWDTYFGLFGIKAAGLKDVVVGQPEALLEAGRALRDERPEALRDVYLWHAMDMAASYADDESRALSFKFWGTAMSGKTQDKPRWKRAVASVESGLGEGLGQLYVARYFPPEAKERMERLVANLQTALGERIDAQDWMSPGTRKVAREKLDAFYVKVGYPSKWADYSDLRIGDSYLANMMACREWAVKDMIRRHLGKPVDRDEWYMTPQTVNAYYNPTTNEICFPAGILQPPFFDMSADDAFNYGAIGVVIGHEMTHGFDDQGSKYDKDGNLRKWWTEADTRRFEERIAVMRAYHDSIEVLPGLRANGSLTLGENLADHGGLMVALQALRNATADAPLAAAGGFTPEQRFFLAYAGVWGQNIRGEEIQKRVKSDPHQLGKWRVNGQLPHIDAWYEAFGVKEGDPMYVPKEKRVAVW